MRLLTTTLFALLFVGVNAQTQPIPGGINIWPSAAPGNNGLNLTELVTPRTPTIDCTIDRAVSNISTPTITPYVAPNGNGTAILLCPGGAYLRETFDLEGASIAQWFNSLGITAFVLRYRLPLDAFANSSSVPMQDAQRAMRYIRKNAAQWGVDPNKLGIMGGSAGGHLAASVGIEFDKLYYSPIDDVDNTSAQSNFMMLLYPVISMDPTICHAGSRDSLIGKTPTDALIKEFSVERHVKANAPKTFIALAGDDTSVKPINSERLRDSLAKVGVSCEYHKYTNGGHGKAICKATGTDFANWVVDAQKWLVQQNLTSGIDEKYSHAKSSFEVFPNPINPNSVIEYNLVTPTDVSFSIINAQGNLLYTETFKEQTMGLHSIAINKNITSHPGIYFIKMDDGVNSINKKVVINK